VYGKLKVGPLSLTLQAQNFRVEQPLLSYYTQQIRIFMFTSNVESYM